MKRTTCLGHERNKRRIVLLSGIIMVFLFMSACGKKKEEEIPELIEPVDSTSEMTYAEIRDVYEIISYETYVIPYMEELCFDTTGTVEEICVFYGEHVEAGQKLATLEDASSKQYEQLQNELSNMQEASAHANEIARLDIELAKKRGEDTARLELLLSQNEEMQALEESYLLDKLSQIQKDRGKRVMTAPFEGTVVSILNDGKGSSVSEITPVIVLADESRFYVTGDYISEKNFAKYDDCYALFDGKEYAITYEPYTAEELEKYVGATSDLKSRYRLEGDTDLMLGQYGLVCLVWNERHNVLTLPKEAIYTEGSQSYVYVNEDGNREMRMITTGVEGAMYVEILDGIEEGACVYVKN